MANIQFHHSVSEASLGASSEGGDAAGPDAEPLLDSGIKLPPGADIFPAEVTTLRPTQVAVGMQQVQDKMRKVKKRQAKGPAALDEFLRDNPIPVVIGPGQAMYLIDHHHLARALYECGVKTCYAGAARDFSALDEAAFWAEMATARCLWPHAADGARLELPQLQAALPHTVAELKDDPYRSLAALVRKSGGFQKSAKPFSEFMWANFLRPRVPLALEGPGDVAHFVGRALSHATSDAAAGLPGHTPLASLGPEQLDLMADGLMGGLGGKSGKEGKGKDGKSKEGKSKEGKGKEGAAAEPAAEADAGAAAAPAEAAPAEAAGTCAAEPATGGQA